MKSRNTSIHYIPGSNEILLTAPHAVNYRRKSLSNAVRQAEQMTDVIVRDLCELTGSHGLIITEPPKYDPNLDPEKANQFKREVRKLIEEQKIRFLVDLHGLSENYPYDIGIYAVRNRFRARGIAQNLLYSFRKGDLRDVSAHFWHFPSHHHESLSHFSSEGWGVHSIQIEVAKYIREDDTLRSEFVKNLATTLMSL